MAITHKSFALGQNVTSTSATARQLIVSAMKCDRDWETTL